MKFSSLGLIGIFFLALPGLLWAATPAPTTYYVSTHGFDGSDGLTPNTAFGSVTRAVQALAAADQSGQTDNCQVYIAAGDYLSDTLVLSNFTSVGSVEFQGDEAGGIFSYGGPVRILATANQSSSVLLQNMRSVGFRSLVFIGPPAGATFQRMLRVENCTGVTWRECEVWAQSHLWDGIVVSTPSSNVVVDSCVVSHTGTGVLLDKCSNSWIQNSWLKDNTTGATVANAVDCVLVNNAITGNQYGLDLQSSCAGTVLFNNLVSGNGTPGGAGAEIKTDYAPRRDDPQVLPSDPQPSWRSSDNLIGGQGRTFAELSGPGGNGALIAIPHQKLWQEYTGQDLWGQSLSYAVAFPYPFEPRPDTTGKNWAHGSMSFLGHSAPAYDYFQQPRPQGIADIGCVETMESPGMSFHHVGLTPQAMRAAPGQAITVQVELLDSVSHPSYYPPDYNLYLFLQDGDLPTQVDSHGQISANGPVPLHGTSTQGLYYVQAADTTAPVSFSVQVRRDLTLNDGQAYLFRVVEWENWYSNQPSAQGGRADPGTTALQWTNPPDRAASRVTATSPVLASGQHPSRVLMQIRDQADAPVTGLQATDFLFSVSGGTVTLDPATFAPVAGQTGDYQIDMTAAQSGTRSLAVTVLGVALNDHPSVDFQPGVYGQVSDQGSGQLLSGIHLTLTAPDGAAAGAVDSQAGDFALLVPAPSASPYLLAAEDPLNNYTRGEVSVTLPANTALRQDLALNSIVPEKLGGHAYPNPIQRGGRATVVYSLPKSGLVKLEVFDLRGRRVLSLVHEHQNAGNYRLPWDCQNRFGQNLAPGTYLLALQLDSLRQTFKLVIIP